MRRGLACLLLFGAACGRSGVGLDTEGTSDSGATTIGGVVDMGPGTTTGPPPPPDVPPVVECRFDLDCPVADPCFMGRCEEGRCQTSPLDFDDDGFGPLFCGGDDCNDFNPNTNPGQVEQCFDADDNDCNGVADCFDPACEGVPDCGCRPDPGGEICDNGEDEDCDTRVDCGDSDCLGTPACGCAPDEVGACGNGFDDDCDGRTDCEDEDCAGDPVCGCQGVAESCTNGSDDDCDGLIDCTDPDCEGLGVCVCMGPPAPEVCGDGRDNDCDDLVDCADPDCVVSPTCASCTTEVCTNGEDDDCDGRVDCADDACAFDPACAPVPELCNNNVDDDNDGDIDCDDLDCANVPLCVEEQANCNTAKPITGPGSYFGDTTGHTDNEQGSCGGGAGEAVFSLTLNQPAQVILDSVGTSFDSVLYVRSGACEVGTELACDDDSGGSLWSARIIFDILPAGTYFVFLDGFTTDPVGGPNEGPFQLNVEINENPIEICDDGRDNDGDVFADCADPDCAGFPACIGCGPAGQAPTAEFGTAACTDGLDNDCDGDVDCGDEDCDASFYYLTECCNGTDENDNGIPDDFNCRCASDADCDGGQICYDHSSFTCGFPCTAFFGNICPFVAPGSFCNDATQQCEF
jgi:hypothetical protein